MYNSCALEQLQGGFCSCMRDNDSQTNRLSEAATSAKKNTGRNTIIAGLNRSTNKQLKLRLAIQSDAIRREQLEN